MKERCIQGGDDVVLLLSTPNFAFHLDLMGPAQNDACQSVFDDSRKMGLVYDGQDIISAFDGKGDETGILDDKNVILWV